MSAFDEGNFEVRMSVLGSFPKFFFSSSISICYFTKHIPSVGFRVDNQYLLD